MVDVDVDVQHPRVVLEQLEDGQHDVVDVAEAGGLALLGVVQPPRPVDDDVVLPSVEPPGAGDAAAGVDLAELVQARENRAVLADAEPDLLLPVRVLVLRAHLLQELDVLLRVELAHIVVQRSVRLEDVHHLVHLVVGHEVVRHLNPVGLHRVAVAVVEVSDIRIVEVGDPVRAVLAAHL